MPALSDLAAVFASALLTPDALLEDALARIAELNPAINAVVTLDTPRAKRAAEASTVRWRASAPLSSIDGVPVLVKANIAVAELPWHAGIAAYAGRIADADAPAVARARAAGAVILGLTNMDEGGLGATGDNCWLGRTIHPHRPDLCVGGSSGGSAAAIAAGFAVIALSSDTIGSIAIPASYCGVAGHRASRGLMTTDGVVPLSPRFDRVGWLASSVGDALTFAVALGLSPRGSGPLRVATIDPADISAPLAEAYDATVARLRGLGLAGDPLRLPLKGLSRRLFEVAEADAAVVYADAVRARPEGFSPAFARMLAWGAAKGSAALPENLRAIGAAAAAIRAMLVDNDALLMPATPHAAFAVSGPVPGDQARFTAVPSALGWPATTFPIQCDADGPPLSAMVTATDDATCLAVAGRLAA